MLKVSKLVLVGALWFGACVQAAEAVPAVDPVAKAVAQYTVPGFTAEDIRFVRDAYNTYLDAIKSRSMFAKTVSIFKTIDPVLVDYCNTLLSRFYRAQLVAMAKAAPLNFNILQEAIRVACKGIDKIGHNFIEVVKTKDDVEIEEQIERLQNDHALQIALNAVDKDGRTALLWAFYGNSLPITQPIIGSGFNIEWYIDHARIIKKLLSFKKPGTQELLVDVNAVDKNGATALIVVCNQKNYPMAQVLLEHGANILHSNNKNKSALSILGAELPYTAPSGAGHAIIKSILDVFDALKPDVTEWQLAGMGQGALELKDAYVEFQKGNPEKLSQRLVEYIQLAPKALLPPDINDMMRHFTLPREMLSVFKKESIEPLLKWLIKVTTDEDVTSKLQDVLYEYMQVNNRSYVKEANAEEAKGCLVC